MSWRLTVDSVSIQLFMSVWRKHTKYAFLLSKRISVDRVSRLINNLWWLFWFLQLESSPKYLVLCETSAGKIRQQLACSNIPARPETSEQAYLRKVRNYCRRIPDCPQRFNHQMFPAASDNFLFNCELRTWTWITFYSYPTKIQE